MPDLVERRRGEREIDDPSEESARSRRETYEQSTSTGRFDQEDWHGRYDLPVPGDSGQQQDYVHQQNYPGPHTERELPREADDRDDPDDH